MKINTKRHYYSKLTQMERVMHNIGMSSGYLMDGRRGYRTVYNIYHPFNILFFIVMMICSMVLSIFNTDFGTVMVQGVVNLFVKPLKAKQVKELPDE